MRIYIVSQTRVLCVDGCVLGVDWNVAGVTCECGCVLVCVGFLYVVRPMYSIYMYVQGSLFRLFGKVSVHLVFKLRLRLAL